MSTDQDSFNPYHKWLGLSKDETNPNHYRLLGITEFESDIEVISTAADSRMMLLRTFQTGKYSALSQKLLNEVSAARVCLLQPDKKAEYDEKLKKEKALQAPAGDDGTHAALASIASEFAKVDEPASKGGNAPESADRFGIPTASPVAPPKAVSDGGSFIFADNEPASQSGIGRNSSAGKSKISKAKYAAGSSQVGRNGSKKTSSGSYAPSKSGKRDTSGSGEASSESVSTKKGKKSPLPLIAIGVVIAIVALGGSFFAAKSNSSKQAQRHYKAAKDFAQADNYELAAKEIASAIKIAKEEKFLKLQGEIKTQLEQKGIAEEAYRKALEHEKAGNWEPAKTEIQRAVGMFPKEQKFTEARDRILAAADRAQAKEAKKLAKEAKKNKNKGKNKKADEKDSDANSGDFSLGGNESEFTEAKANWRLPLHEWLVNKTQGFNGTSDTIPLGNPDDMNFEGKITLAAWVKMNSIPTEVGEFQNIFGHGFTMSPSAEVVLRCGGGGGGEYQIGSWDGAEHGAAYTIPAEDVEQWVSLIGVYDGKTWKLYRNGQLVASNPDSVGSVKVGADWYIGSCNGEARFFNGEMRNVAIWNKALTPSEIQAMYEYQLALLEGRDPNSQMAGADGAKDAGKGKGKDKKDQKAGQRPLRGTFPLDIHGEDRGEMADDQIRTTKGDGLNAGDKITKKIDGVDFVFHWCPAGTFKMGVGRNAEEVTIEHGFWMLESEVTQSMWQSVMGENPSKTFVEPDLPVNNVSWKDCRDFCQKLSEKTSLPIALPTEEQWEYACRAGVDARYNFGTKLDPERASEASIDMPVMTHVNERPANSWGLFHMHDNVGEWCLGQGKDGKEAQILRGTGRSYGMQSGSSHDRIPTDPSTKSDTDGFRFVINPEK